MGNQNSVIENGRINFSAKILGVICQTNTLNSTDTVLGNPATRYPTGQGARGYENNAERIELSSDMRSFILHRYHATFPGENTRIITGPGGAPSSYGMNNQVTNSARGLADQAMITDYEKAVIDLDTIGGSDFQWDPQANLYRNPYVDLRHFDGVNVLYFDGSVRTQNNELFFDPTARHWKGLEDE